MNDHLQVSQRVFFHFLSLLSLLFFKGNSYTDDKEVLCLSEHHWDILSLFQEWKSLLLVEGYLMLWMQV